MRHTHATAPQRLRSAETDARIASFKGGVDRTLLAENLRRTVDERFRQLMELQRFAEELKRAGRRASHDRF
jgi:hypothetical protein